MRKTSLLLSLLLCGILSSRLMAQEYKFGAGLRLSTPSPTLSSSVSLKYFLNDRAAIEGLIAFGTRFGLGALYEVHSLIGATPNLYWFYGGGGYVGFQNGRVYSGPTGIIGLDYKFSNAPINLSLDWKPELDIAPEINFIPDALALSVRFTLD
jgi:hypothetical protein